MTDTNYRDLIYSPSEASTDFVKYAEGLKSQPGIKWGVKSLDNAIVPMHPGDIVGIIARPGHGKSSIASYLARYTAKQIAADSTRSGECVVYVTFEQSIEEIEAVFQSTDSVSVSDIAWGRADMEEVKRGSVSRLSLPVWLMGRGMQRRKRIPRMTVDNVYRAISEMENDYKLKPALVVFDYVQLIPIEKNAERTQQVTEAIVRSKELASYIAAPIVVCVQASRGVDKYDVKLPTVADCQHASAIEQTADKLISIWRPSLTETNAEHVKINGNEIKITPQLMIAKLLKQRMEQAGQVFPLSFAPQYVRLADLELRYAELDN